MKDHEIGLLYGAVVKGLGESVGLIDPPANPAGICPFVLMLKTATLSSKPNQSRRE